jgi:hypothetical protein
MSLHACISPLLMAACEQAAHTRTWEGNRGVRGRRTPSVTKRDTRDTRVTQEGLKRSARPLPASKSRKHGLHMRVHEAEVGDRNRRCVRVCVCARARGRNGLYVCARVHGSDATSPSLSLSEGGEAGMRGSVWGCPL